jgi:hypothetical protein
MTKEPLRILWLVTVVLWAAAGWRAARLPDPYGDGAPVGVVEDRRENRFRHLTHSQTTRILEHLIESAANARDRQARARQLARVAAVQRERGLAEASEYAAREAMRYATDAAEVRRILETPFDLEAYNQGRLR